MEQTEAQTRFGQLERIVDAWQDYLFRFAYMRTGVREEAEVIRLKCNDELTFTEIACLTGVSESTVKSRYRYGIRHINEQLEREGNGE